MRCEYKRVVVETEESGISSMKFHFNLSQISISWPSEITLSLSSAKGLPFPFFPLFSYWNIPVTFSMADEVVHSLEKMKLTLDEEEVIVILEEGQKEEIERCA